MPGGQACWSPLDQSLLIPLSSLFFNSINPVSFFPWQETAFFQNLLQKFILNLRPHMFLLFSRALRWEGLPPLRASMRWSIYRTLEPSLHLSWFVLEFRSFD